MLHVCTCGFAGEATRTYDDKDPNPFNNTPICPMCGEMGVKGSILLDVGVGRRYVTMTNDGSTWTKEIKTDVVELRMASDVRRISKWTWSNWGFGIFWEVQRLLDPEFPKKPKMKDFEDKGLFFKAHKEFKPTRNTHLNKVFSINDLFTALKREYNADIAKERARSLVTSIFGGLNVKMTDTFKLRDVWSLAISRSKTADKMIDMFNKRTTVDDLLVATDGKEEFEGIHNIMLAIHSEYGNIGIRPSVVKAIRKAGFGMFEIHGASYTPYPKSTRKYDEWIEAHKEDFFENPEFSMDRGKEVIDYDKEVVVGYDPESEEMIELRDLDGYEAPVSYKEWSSDDYDYYYGNDEVVDASNDYPHMSAGFERPDSGVEFNSAPRSIMANLNALTRILNTIGKEETIDQHA